MFYLKENIVVYTIFANQLRKCHLVSQQTSTLTQTISFMECQTLYLFFHFINKYKQLNTILQYTLMPKDNHFE